MNVTAIRNLLSPCSANDIPDILDVLGLSEGAGKRFFVGSTVPGCDGLGGKRVTHPFATVAQALAKCTAAGSTYAGGDTIYCLPGHTETITAAAGLALSKAGVRLIGLGRGRLRPIFNYTTAAAASFDISAANVEVNNVVIRPQGVDAVTAAINVSAADVWLRNCEIELAGATNQATLGVLTTAAANRLLIERCHIHGTADAGTSAAIRIVGGTDITIRDNIITGAFATTGNIENITTASVNLMILNNFLLNQTADGNNKLIKVDGSTTGLICGNRGGMIDSTGPAPVTAAAMFVGGNWFSSAAGTTASVLM